MWLIFKNIEAMCDIEFEDNLIARGVNICNFEEIQFDEDTSQAAGILWDEPEMLSAGGAMTVTCTVKETTASSQEFSDLYGCNDG